MIPVSREPNPFLRRAGVIPIQDLAVLLVGALGSRRHQVTLDLQCTN